LITTGYAVFGCFFAIGLTDLTRYGKIRVDMKFQFFGNANKTRKTLLDTKQEILVKQGREQFKKLLEKGISIPVVFL
jgi:hypothetical protein